MGKHLLKNGFTPDYTRWVHHGEAHRLREEVVRPRVEDFDPAAEVADMLDDFHKGQYTKGRTEEEMEATAKAFYEMMSSAQKIPSRSDNSFSTRCHWTFNGVQVQV
jgi:hypothetical protein